MKTRLTLPKQALALVVAALALALLACAGPIPLAANTPTPCPANCPPPARLSSTGHTVTLTGFRFTYFDPWSLDTANSDSHSATLVAQSQLGQVSILLESVSVSPGETSQRLLASAVNSNLNSGQFTGAQDQGPINGAEIGYVAGSGESYAAAVSQSNAPDQPVYLDFMASVRGSTGIVFIGLSPLDPNSPDPSIVPNQDYDHIVNSVEWT